MELQKIECSSLFWQQHQSTVFSDWCHSVSCNTRALKELSDRGVGLWRLALQHIQFL